MNHEAAVVVPEADRTPVISVAIPVYNAADCLERLVERLLVSLRETGLEWEVILVDDASADRSFAELERLRSRHPGLVVRRNPENLGQHATIVRALSLARGRLSVIMDCDLQDDPELIPTLVRRLEAGGADAVVVRYSNYANGLLRYGLSRLHSLSRRFQGRRNNDPRLAVYRVFCSDLRTHVVQTFTKGRLFRDLFDPQDWRIEYLDAARSKRFAGQSSYTVSALFKTVSSRR